MGDDVAIWLMPEFASLPGGRGVVVRLDADEARVLRRLADELSSLLAGSQPGDPVVDRIFPAAYEDPVDERAYRDMVGDDLAHEKLTALGAVSTAVDREEDVDLTIEGDDIPVWLAALTDLRLALGTRLDVDEERMAADVDPRHPDAAALAALHWLGWIQEGIIANLQPAGP